VAPYIGKDVHLEISAFYNSVEGFIYPQKLSIKESEDTFQFKQNNSFLYDGGVVLNVNPQPVQWLERKNSLRLVKGIFTHQKDKSMRYIPAIPAVKKLPFYL